MKDQNNSIFYGVVAANSLAVFDDDLKLEDAIVYMPGCKITEYKKKAKAIKATIDKYNDLQMNINSIDGYYNESNMSINWVYYKKKL